jgi:predicted transcriptional regulator
MKAIKIYVPDEQVRRLDVLSGFTERSRSELIRLAIDVFLESRMTHIEKMKQQFQEVSDES